MNTPKKSFWSSLPGLITGIAGVLGAVVGLVGVLISLGVIGGSNSPTTVTTVPGSAGTSGATSGSSGSGGGTTATTVAQGSFTVDVNALVLSLAKPKGTVTVFNNGAAALKMTTDVSGPDAGKFTVLASGCTSSPLQAKKSCSIDVTFAGGLSATATMRVSADKAPDTASVTLTGSL